MKKMNMTVLVAAALTISASGWAHEPRQGHQPFEGPADPATQVVERLHRALRQLDLSEEQSEAIRREFRAMQESIKPLRMEMHETRRSLHELLTAESYDSEAVSALAADQGETMADMIRITSATAHSVLSQLTDAQRAELADLREQRRERLAKNLGKLQQRLEQQGPGG
jgi:Spy/CpxP family protein refolding chaperone